jgi:hypothetical protein
MKMNTGTGIGRVTSPIPQVTASRCQRDQSTPNSALQQARSDESGPAQLFENSRAETHQDSEHQDRLRIAVGEQTWRKTRGSEGQRKENGASHDWRRQKRDEIPTGTNAPGNEAGGELAETRSSVNDGRAEQAGDDWSSEHRQIHRKEERLLLADGTAKSGRAADDKKDAAPRNEERGEEIERNGVARRNCPHRSAS